MGILKTREYPKRSDTFRLSETWDFQVISDNFSKEYVYALHFGRPPIGDNRRMISMMSLFFLFLRSSSLFRFVLFVFLLFEFVSFSLLLL